MNGEVSIHALLAECDGVVSFDRFQHRSFNPRTPCGVRLEAAMNFGSGIKFQSTHSLRSATWGFLSRTRCRTVSIHALLAECDRLTPFNWAASFLFQSTHSLRSATTGYRHLYGKQLVSIHALLAECDRPVRLRPDELFCFNPRTPCGVRPALRKETGQFRLFQSTHSLRSATEA